MSSDIENDVLQYTVGAEMNPIRITISMLVVFATTSAGRGDDSTALANWDYVDFLPRKVTYHYLGRTSEGLFGFKRVGGAVEPWTPEVTLELGKTSPDGLLKVVRSIGRAVEVQIAPDNKRIRLDPNAKTTATTIFIGFHPHDGGRKKRRFFVEVGKRFKFPGNESEFIVTDANADIIRVLLDGRDAKEPITIQRRTRNQPPTSAWRAMADPSRVRMIHREFNLCPASSARSRSAVPHA